MFKRLRPPAVVVDGNHEVVRIAKSDVMLIDQRKFDRIIATRVAEVRAEYSARLDDLDRRLQTLARSTEEASR
jgi:hypothetical protein